MDKLGQVDLCVVMDTTGSMDPYLEEAKKHVRTYAERIANAGGLDMRYAVVEFRDHVPQDTMLTRAFPFSSALDFQRAVNHLVARGGGDDAEAVWDGIYAAANLDWREASDNIMFLIGDAPPHGVGYYGDKFPEGCPCGLRPAGLVELLASKKIRLFAHSIAGLSLTAREFTALAEATGGTCTVVERPADSTHAYAKTVGETGWLIDHARTYENVYARTATSMPDASREAVLSKTRETLRGWGWSDGLIEYTNNYLDYRHKPAVPRP